MPKTSQNTCQNRDFKKPQIPGVDCLTLQFTSIEAPESELGDSSHRKVPICHTWVLNMQWNLRVFQDFRPRMQTPSNGQAGKHNDWRAISMGPTCNILNVNLNSVSNMVYQCLDTSSVSGHPFDKTHIWRVSIVPTSRLRFLMEGAVNSAELHEFKAFNAFSFKRLERNGACCLPNHWSWVSERCD